MIEPNPADLPDVKGDNAIDEAGMLPQTAEEGVTPTTDEVDPNDMFGAAAE